MDAEVLSKKYKEAYEKLTPEQIAEAKRKIVRLEELGFFYLCGCSMGEPDVSSAEETED